MHLRLDRPDRAARLAQWVGSLGAGDTLHLIGDVCDFWYASRQIRPGPPACPGLRALADFRERGGSLTVLVGNHDLWLAPYYERVLGARLVSEPLQVEAYGLRLTAVHGHRAGSRKPWKAFMESHAFLSAFSALPAPVAGWLDHRLERTNDGCRPVEDSHTLAAFRRAAGRLRGSADVAVFGHVHQPIDDPESSPRFVVLGGWQEGGSYLRVDEAGATHVVLPREAPVHA
jgi:UDP-2,3-diacylglucosamine hydrolase